MQTARMLEAEWWQVLQGNVSMGTKEDESSTRHVWAAGFHHVMAHSHFPHVLKLNEPFISLIFKLFFSASETMDN
jgi:hypothetical protein